MEIIVSIGLCSPGTSLVGILIGLNAFSQSSPNWTEANQELLKHFQSLVRLNTTDPPGNEAPAVEYLKQAFAADGIEVKILGTDPKGRISSLASKATAASSRCS